VEAIAQSVVRIGSHVRLRDDQAEAEFALVGTHDADAAAGRLSAESPLGRALIGRRAGEQLLYRAPGGVLAVTVLSVRDGDGQS
jgi:transcription elongation GreA/GreB family factor